MTLTDAPIFAKGDRVRDPLTGSLGTHAGIGHLTGVVPGQGSRIVTLITWDESGMTVPFVWRLEKVEGEEE